QIIMPMTMLAMFFTENNKALGATNRITGILDHDEEAGAKETIPEDSLQFRTPEIKDMTVCAGVEIPVLQGTDLRAEHNRKVACVGPSGSGKATIFALIERYYDILSGAIEIDGIDIRDIPLASLRKNIGYVAQESAIISGTIFENITYGLED